MKARLVVIRVQPCIGVSMKAPFVVIRVQPCLGVSMKAPFVVIRVQQCFDLGLLGTLGSGLGEFRDFPGPQHLICVSLGTSQVLWNSFGLFMYSFGL